MSGGEVFPTDSAVGQTSMSNYNDDKEVIDYILNQFMDDVLQSELSYENKRMLS